MGIICVSAQERFQPNHRIQKKAATKPISASGQTSLETAPQMPLPAKASATIQATIRADGPVFTGEALSTLLS